MSGLRCERASPLASSISLFSIVPTTVDGARVPCCCSALSAGEQPLATHNASSDVAANNRDVEFIVETITDPQAA
jgi:hypothetical protein